MKIGLRGRYRLEVRKKGVLTKQTGWFDNLITDLGMNQIGTLGTYLDACQVGSSSAAPAFTNVALGSRVAGVSAPVVSNIINSEQRYFIRQNIFTFPVGAAAGNLAEIGVGPSPTAGTLFSRALILDAFGNPTTITVLADEVLVVVYQLWHKQPVVDFLMTVSGKETTIRACAVNTLNDDTGWGNSLSLISRRLQKLYQGSLGPITGEPGGTSALLFLSTSLEAYVAGSHFQATRITVPTGSGNGFPIKSISWNMGCTRWQAEFDTPYTKTNLQTLSFLVGLSWARDSGPTP